MTSGPSLAVLSAILFGASPLLTKVVIQSSTEMTPILLAGLLYLGSGIGLALMLAAQRINPVHEIRRLAPASLSQLSGSIIAGGILAPLAFAYSISSASAFEVSLLLNLETVATTAIAFLLFREHVGRHVLLSKGLILLGAVALSVGPTPEGRLSSAALWMVAACMLWGLDNNLTRNLEMISPSVLAALKGLVAGLFNLLIAIPFTERVPPLPAVFGTLVIGAFCYGLSLVLFILALRKLGAARVGTYFAAGPFFGMLLSIGFLREQPTTFQWASSAIIAFGVWLLSRERHEHLHNHGDLMHSHPHWPDLEHRHKH
ncbi:MAG: hypothetical protein A2428_07505 [Bdellovibrionales bacterium RIFOXYC1_FULL_54_43]|nr:MAG: hypothetical protein A2428_07505 [Bdellovibrionales bacterium RIFOXYC1_FULL_54_43]OFZ84035.1 MAG: hypothetical protein A2603_15745 [Bdellovibrionales bacterium RIFOXYD1_FULL_55_31]